MHLRFVFLFRETKLLEHFKLKVRALLPLVLSCLEVAGKSWPDQRQRALSCWSEQSRQMCWGWKGGVHGGSFTWLSMQFVHSGLWVCGLGHSFCQGGCRDSHTAHTHTPQSIQNLPWIRTFTEQAGILLSLWGTEVSINSKGSLRPVYYSLSEASSR